MPPTSSLLGLRVIFAPVLFLVFDVWRIFYSSEASKRGLGCSFFAVQVSPGGSFWLLSVFGPPWDSHVTLREIRCSPKELKKDP